MKAIRIFDLPSLYLEQNSFPLPNENYSYSQKMSDVFADNYGQSNNVGISLNELGYECLELLPNLQSAQKQWLKEHDFNVSLTENWKLEILEIQIEYYKPETLIFAGWSYGGEYIQHLKNRFSFLRKLILCFGESLPPMKFISSFDHVITHDPKNVSLLKQSNIKATHIYHAFNPSAELIQKKVITNFLTFAGSIKHGDSEHTSRAKILENLMTTFQDVKVYSSVIPPTLYGENIKGKLVSLFHNWLAFLESIDSLNYSPRSTSYNQMKELRAEYNTFNYLRKRVLPPVYGKDYLTLMANSMLVLNIHSNTSYSCNMRMFEVGAMKSALIAEEKQNTFELFEAEKEIITFKNQPELLEKVAYLKDHPAKCEEIGINAYKRIMAEHTYRHRAPQYLDVILQ